MPIESPVAWLKTSIPTDVTPVQHGPWVHRRVAGIASNETNNVDLELQWN